MKLSCSEISRLWPIAKRRLANSIISFVKRVLMPEKMVRNVFGTKHSKRVLLCHLPEAFKSSLLPKHHSNLTECYTVARCVDRLGYRVDCCSRAKEGIDYSPYSVVFGINGNAFMGSFRGRKECDPLRIFYSVGAHTCYNYRVTSERNREFHDRHGLWFLGSNRYMPGDARNYYEAHFSDVVICLGDKSVQRNFIADDNCEGKYRHLNAFYFNVATPDEAKDFNACRRNILWFGSAGMIHKGLDIAIDFAVAHPEFTLHICGGSRQEKDFMNYYSPLIEKYDNILWHGFVDIESPLFEQLLGGCGILLNPSISEGGAVSVLNVLGNGALLPVYSQGTGLELDSVGIVVTTVTYSAFEKALLAADSMPIDEFREKAWAAYRLVSDNYRLDTYEENMYNILKDITENNK